MGRATRLRRAARALLLAAIVGGTSGCAVWRSGGLVDRSEPMGEACRLIPVVGGPEDVAPDPRGGFYVSASDWRGREDGGTPKRGRLYRLDFDAAGDLQPVDVTPAAPADFQPHGIDLWTGPDGEQRLFVVNHPVGGDSRVEIFAVTPAGLVDTGEGGAWPLLHRPNDLAATGPASFFASNDHRVKRKAWFDPSPLESAIDISGWPNGYVVRVDRGVAARAAGGLSLANGVALSPDRRRLYVAESAMGRIAMFDVLADGGLRRRTDALEPGPGPDNIFVDAEGDLWIGAHNNGLDFLRHAMNAGHPSPGRVVRLSPTGARRVVYQSGRKPVAGRPQLWAVSAGVPDGRGGVVAGNIFTPAVEHCRRQASSVSR